MGGADAVAITPALSGSVCCPRRESPLFNARADSTTINAAVQQALSVIRDYRGLGIIGDRGSARIGVTPPPLIAKARA
jgi:hypothetical protein